MPLPPEWRSFFVGRKVEHPDIPGVAGVVKYADCTRLGIPKELASSDLAIDISWVVEWANGIVEVLDQVGVANIATDEFVDEPWVLDRVLALQRGTHCEAIYFLVRIYANYALQCGWNEAEASRVLAAQAKASTSNNKPKAKKSPAKTGQSPGAKQANKAKPPAHHTRIVDLNVLKRKHVGKTAGQRPVAKKSRPATTLAAHSPAAEKSPLGTGGTSIKVTTTVEAIPDDSAALDVSSPPALDSDMFGILDSTKASGVCGLDAKHREAAIATATSPRKRTRTSSKAPVSKSRAPRDVSSADNVASSEANTFSEDLAEIANSTLAKKSAPTACRVGDVDVYRYDSVRLDGVDYRIYSRDVVVAEEMAYRWCAEGGKPKDMTIEEWKLKGEYEDTEEYNVDCIIAERAKGRSKKQMEFLIKYTGFELDIGGDCWLSQADVDEIEAYDKWLQGGKASWQADVEKLCVAVAAGASGAHNELRVFQ